MPYCPTCNREYRRGKAGCPDCRQDLVDAPWESVAVDGSHMPSGPSDDLHLEVIYSSDSEVDVRRAEAFLKAEGIECLMRWATMWPGPMYVVVEPLVGYWGRSPSRHGGQVVVNAEDADRARDLLESLEPVVTENSAEDGEDGS